MSEQVIWFYESKGERKGGVSTTEIIELINQGVITQGAQVWKKGMPTWVIIEDSELFQYIEDIPPPLNTPTVSNDLPPPLNVESVKKEKGTTSNTNEESFSTKFAGIWRFIYAPTFAALATYLVSFVIKGNSWQAFNLWSTSGMAVISFAIVIIAWGEDFWRFRKSTSYTGWSWWWLFSPCYIHDRMGKQWKWTVGLTVLSLACSMIASKFITLHGEGYFDGDESYEYQSNSNNYNSNRLPTSIGDIERFLTNRFQSQTYVTQINDVLFQYEYCSTEYSCVQEYLKTTPEGYICKVNGKTKEEADSATDCASEAFDPRML